MSDRPFGASMKDASPHSNLNQEGREQFVAHFVRSQWALYSYIFSLTPNWSDAQDIFQQTSMVLWRKFDQFDQESPESNFVRWACRIARFETLNHMKKNRRDRLVFSDKLLEILAEEGMSETERLEDERRALASCLGQLQTDHRRLIKEAYAGARSIKQIAMSRGCSPTSLYNRLFRIRMALLRCIKRSLAEEGAS
jgi:RNA polymerase sigma-70 factor (ECF subfamily)